MYTKKTNQKAEAIDLDKEYSPSRNSKRFLYTAEPNKEVIKEFLRITTQQTQQAREKYRVRQCVTYKNVNSDANVFDNQVVDIYYKDEENGSPIFVYIHGGYWQELDRHTSASFVAPLVEQGFRVIVVDYNICPRVTLQTISEQMYDFYGWLFKYAEDTRASKISLSGHSAGAHLTTLLLNKSLLSFPLANRLVSIFLISGIYDLRECWSLQSVNPMNIWNLDAHSSEALSPLCWELDSKFIEFAKQISLKIYVLVGENDSETFRAQSQAFVKKLANTGLQIELKIFPNYDHFNIIEEVSTKNSCINTFLLEKLVKSI